MAVTGRKSHRLAALLWGGLLLTTCLMGRTDDSANARGQISHLANALSEGNPASAMSFIDSSYAHYAKLRDYFTGLTAAFQIANGVSFSDEQDDKDQITFSVHWDLTLTDLQTNYTENRAADLTIKLIREKSKWKIADIEPIELFNPAKTRTSGAP